MISIILNFQKKNEKSVCIFLSYLNSTKRNLVVGLAVNDDRQINT